MFKWVEIATENNQARYELLSEFLKDNNFPNSVEFIQTKVEDLSQILNEVLLKFDGVRIGRGLGEVVIPLFVRHDAMSDRIRAADSAVKTNNTWWLRANAVDGFSRVLRHYGEKFDFLSPVLVVGAGAAARVAITALFIAGFKNFSVSSHDSEKVMAMITELKKSLFGINFKIVLKDELILLPGSHGILVNTTPLTKDNPMLDELYYFNFFSSNGLAIDFSVTPVDTPLLIAALDVGVPVIYGYQISAATDIIWCEQITGQKFEDSVYEKNLGQRLRKAI